MTKRYITFRRELTDEQEAALRHCDDKPFVLKPRGVVATIIVCAITAALLALWVDALRTYLPASLAIAALVVAVALGLAMILEQLLRTKRCRRYSQLRAAMLAKHSVISDTSKQDKLLAKFYHKETAQTVLAEASKSLRNTRTCAIKIELDGKYGQLGLRHVPFTGGDDETMRTGIENLTIAIVSRKESSWDYQRLGCPCHKREQLESEIEHLHAVLDMDNMDSVYGNQVICLHGTWDRQHMRSANKQAARDTYDAFLLDTSKVYQKLSEGVDDETAKVAEEYLRNKAKACATNLRDIEQKDITECKEIQRQREHEAELKQVTEAEHRAAKAAVDKQQQAIKNAEIARIAREEAIKAAGEEAAEKFVRDEQVRVNSAELRAIIDNRLS